MNEYNQEQIATEIAELLNSDRFLDALIGKTGGAQSGGSLVVRSNGRQVTAIAVGEVPPGDCVALRDTNTGQWYAVSSYDEGKNDDHLIRYRKWRQPDDEVVYPVITLFSIEEETTRIYLGGNKSSKRMTARDGEYIDIPSEINGNRVFSSDVKGFISGKNIYFNYKNIYGNIFLSIIQGQKYLVSLDSNIQMQYEENRARQYVGTKYIGDGVWESHRRKSVKPTNHIVDNEILDEYMSYYYLIKRVITGNHTVVVNGEFQNYPHKETLIFQNHANYFNNINRTRITREYQTWNGNWKESVEATSSEHPVSYKDSLDINAPILNFKSAYFLQEFRANITSRGGFFGGSGFGGFGMGVVSEERVYTQEVNRIKLISKNGSTPEKEINSDNFVRVRSYTLESELTINSTSLTLTVKVPYIYNLYSYFDYFDIKKIKLDSIIDMPILFSRAIGNDNYLVYGDISSATVKDIDEDLLVDVLLTISISINITKKVKRPCSFEGLLSNNGSFYSYYFKNNPPVNFMCKQIFPEAQPNLFRGYLFFGELDFMDSESVVRLDSLKGSKIYSVISPRSSTTTTASFVQPPVGSSVTVSVVDSSWMSPGLTIYLQDGGYYTVVSKPSSTSVIIRLRDRGGVVTVSPVPTSRTVSIPPEAASKIDNPVYVEVWKIMEDGKILYSDLITVDYYNITKFLDIRDIYAHNYII